MEIGNQIKARNPSILLVEDNQVNRSIMKMMLEDIGCQVYAVAEGQAALDTLYKDYERYQLVFMDIKLPDIDGIAVTEKIREHERDTAKTSELPIVALTGHLLETEKQRCLDVGMNEFTIKPVDHEELQKILYRLLFPQNN